MSHREILAVRRKNYERLSAGIEPGKGARALFPTLPAGCCPLFFPVLQIHGGRGLRTLLQEHGIECHGFGFDHADIPMERFSLEAELKDKVACLPIHQDLAPHEVDRMAELINSWNRGED